jgi:hypothetical protein
LGLLLAAERPELISVCTAEYAHTEPVLTALAAGCHVLCEKPLAATVAEARRMVEAAVAPLPAGPTALDGGAATLAVWPTAQAPVQYGDSEAWANALETLVATWLEPLAHELRAGRLKQLAIVGDRGPFYTWEPGRWRRWFKRGTQ